MLDGVARLLEVHGGGQAGAVGVQTGPAVRHHRRGEGVKRVPVHAVAAVRLHDLGTAAPLAHLEEDTDAGARASGRVVVDGDGRGHVLGRDEDARFLAGLPDHGLDHVFAGVEVPGGEMPQARRVDGAGPA